METQIIQAISPKHTEISLKLTTHGKYIWSITSVFETDDMENGIQKIKNIDSRLKDSFPSHAKQGSGRVADLEEI